MTDVGRRFLYYGDCGRFEGCGATITLSTATSCRYVPRDPRQRFRVGGARVLYDGRGRPSYVLSGPAATLVRLGERNTLAGIRRVVRNLRPFRGERGRLAPPRVC